MSDKETIVKELKETLKTGLDEFMKLEEENLLKEYSKLEIAKIIIGNIISYVKKTESLGELQKNKDLFFDYVMSQLEFYIHAGLDLGFCEIREDKEDGQK